jgi:4-hydroxy-tetrahydrodipicolinate synthase
MNGSRVGGVWPTMITPFTEDGNIDFGALRALVDWFIEKGVSGLFAVCQSSEMFHLSLQERIALAKAVVEYAGRRVPVIASGHISDSFEEQVVETNRIADTGVDAIVLVSNRLASERESATTWKSNCTGLLRQIPSHVRLGFYECPYPYKRLLDPELLKWCADTGRFYFLKDTSCNLEQIEAKLNAIEGSGLHIFNANSATLLASLRLGVAGYSGVMANFHPELYVWLCQNWRRHSDLAQRLQNFLGLSSLVEHQLYPKCAKYYLQLQGLPVSLYTRKQANRGLEPHQRCQLGQLRDLSREQIAGLHLMGQSADPN